MILETNKIQYERCTVLGYDALRMYDGYSVISTTLVQGYNMPTISFRWLDDSHECFLSVVGTKYHTLLGRGASAYDALIMARNDSDGFTAKTNCTDIVNDLLIQLMR